MEWKAEIKKVMEDRDISMRQFAILVGMSSTYINDVLTKDKPASPMLKLRILDVRGYDLASAAVLRLLLSTDVVEELMKKQKLRTKQNIEELENSADSATEKIHA